MFSVHTQKHATMSRHFGTVFEEIGQETDHVIIVVLSFSKALFSNVFRLHENEKPAFSNFPKNTSEKLRFCDGLEWKIDLIIEIILCFQTVSPAWCGLLKA